MQKLTLTLVVLLFWTNIQAQKNDIPKELDQALTQLHQIHQFNGTVLYAEQGKTVYKKAFGVADFQTNEPLTTTSAFNLASVSKQFFSMCILILSEQQKLQLDDPISKYLPELSYPGVSIRHLLTHTSGIPEYFDVFLRYKGTLDTLQNETLVQMYARVKPPSEFEPSARWAYCNTNYVFLSTIIERVSKMSAAQFMRQYITTPLQLNDTYLYHILMPNTPKNHVVGFKEENGKRTRFDLISCDGVTGDGNMYSSVEDLLKWEQVWYSEKLVKKATIQAALSPVHLKNGTTYPYGFGWFIAKEGELYEHSGGWNGFVNQICRDVKNNRTLIVLSSSNAGIGRNVAKLIFEGKPYTLPATQLMTNIQVIDGTGTPARKADVRIMDKKIIDVGALEPYLNEIVIDGGGKVLTPGFIDTHSHLEGSLESYPEGLAALNQGVTTIVAGQDGYGSWIDSIKMQIKNKPIAINVATYTGQTTLREKAMGEKNLERPATQAEIDQMKTWLQTEMEKGSLGLSTGLEYAGAYFSTQDEVLQLAAVTANAKGRYISHLRSEDVALWDAIEEIINIGRVAKLPVQISHIKIALKDDWGTAPSLLARLESARSEGIDITADCYPYLFWNSTLKVLFPKTDYTNPVSAQFAVEHTFEPSESILSTFAPNREYQGKTIAEIAVLRKETPAQTLMALIALSDEFRQKHPDVGRVETILGKSMLDEDLINLLTWSHTNICSDGANGGHPRGYGSFTRVLGHYVREQKIMSLETAIQKMTSLAAAQTGIPLRGIIAPGYFADLVLLDPATVKDNSSVQSSQALSDGILKVWVNGQCVYEDKQATKRYSGEFLSK